MKNDVFAHESKENPTGHTSARSLRKRLSTSTAISEREEGSTVRFCMIAKQKRELVTLTTRGRGK